MAPAWFGLASYHRCHRDLIVVPCDTYLSGSSTCMPQGGTGFHATSRPPDPLSNGARSLPQHEEVAIAAASIHPHLPPRSMNT